ncbi:hypothetical protein [Pseudobacter ginsenosidimutans]|uniref:Uncharacterized protein n=1 Tax=Pseudobacter ginsenosidimutans TaxID=661488 RepID=A0A4Q7N567_9BACT|nr:hypothetical protein [Pseudobacter ginsenosidimutans]QEC44691.1 hypothetical protein FSB84_24520 [Pseudobacter ginsenosidimutans]RZS76171.1 hypothetical protein EV199_2050 [Pseudobacter ginsenosidimutans]
MNYTLLDEHIHRFVSSLKSDPALSHQYIEERQQRVAYYQSYDRQRILNMTPDEVYTYLSQLWAMLIWGNKHYVVDKILSDNTLEGFRLELVNLLYGDADIESRWNHFRKSIKGMGPAMMSEILCHTFPNDYMLWNRRAHIAMDYLGVPNLPTYDYQLTGRVYTYLSQVCKEMAGRLAANGFEDPTLLAVDYFMWDELQVIEKLSDFKKGKEADDAELALQKASLIIPGNEAAKLQKEELEAIVEFKHNDIRDKLAAIGNFLGFKADIEMKVANGAVVDTVWEATIGNMGRVIYVFEVQTNGSIDSLILNLLKAANNPAVQGLVAVSDAKQIERIKKEVAQLTQLSSKLKYWDFKEVLQVHEQFALSFSMINKLGLVPQGF